MSCKLPYPGRYESHDSWMRRCDSWERERAMWNSFRNSVNWGGYNYRPVQTGGEYQLDDGRKVKVEKVFPSKSKLKTAMRFCRRNFLVLLIVQLGNPNVITSREDLLAVKPENVPYGLEIINVVKDPIDDWRKHATHFRELRREEVYSNDNH